MSFRNPPLPTSEPIPTADPLAANLLARPGPRNDPGAEDAADRLICQVDRSQLQSVRDHSSTFKNEVTSEEQKGTTPLQAEESAASDLLGKGPGSLGGPFVRLFHSTDVVGSFNFNSRCWRHAQRGASYLD